MTLGENLQKLRREKGLSQEEVAQRLFVSRQSVSKWENDQAEPGIDNLKALAGLYGVTLDELAGLTAEVTAAPESEPWESPPVTYDSGEELEEDRRVSWYKGWVTARTVLVVVSNLFSLGAGRINFPFDWIFMLVGLKVRKPWVYWTIVVMVCINVVTFLLFLSSGRSAFLFPLLHIVLSLALTRREIKEYFHLS